MNMSKFKSRLTVSVETGQVYFAQRLGKQPRCVRIRRVNKGLGRWVQPRAFIEEITRKGKIKNPSEELICVNLTYNGVSWIMPPGYVLNESTS